VTGTSGGPVALSTVTFDVTAAVAAGLTNVNANAGAGALCHIELTTNGGTGRGWYIDDLEIDLE
jgi:hypothetical protein